MKKKLWEGLVTLPALLASSRRQKPRGMWVSMERLGSGRGRWRLLLASWRAEPGVREEAQSITAVATAMLAALSAAGAGSVGLGEERQDGMLLPPTEDALKATEGILPIRPEAISSPIEVVKWLATNTSPSAGGAESPGGRFGAPG